MHIVQQADSVTGEGFLHALAVITLVVVGVAGRIMGFEFICALILPFLVVMVISLCNTSYLTFPPPGGSLRRFEKFFTDSNWMSAFWNSLIIASMSAAIAVVLVIGGLVLARPVLTRSRGGH